MKAASNSKNQTEEWTEEPVGALCEIKHGFAFKGTEFSSAVPEGNPLVITPGNFTEDGRLLFDEKNTKRFNGEVSRAFRFDVGDLVVVMTDLSSKMKILGKPAFVETDDVLHNQRIGRVVFLNGRIEKRYLYYFMMGERYLQSIRGSATGTMVKHTAPKRILSNTISFPVAVKSQRRIVGILDEAFAGIATAQANAEKNLQNARALFESHLNAVFTQRGDGWVESTLSELCTLTSGRHILAKNYNRSSRGIGYLTGPADFGKLNPTISRWTEHPQALAQRGDILITVKGAGVGKLNLLDADSVAISRQLMAVRVKDADPLFIYALLNWRFEHFQSLGTGATVPGLSREDILDLQIGLPSLHEQRRIVGQLDELSQGTQRLESIYQRKLAALDELKKSLLHQAFNGELTKDN